MILCIIIFSIYFTINLVGLCAELWETKHTNMESISESTSEFTKGDHHEASNRANPGL
jgi:hypothetical protein